MIYAIVVHVHACDVNMWGAVTGRQATLISHDALGKMASPSTHCDTTCVWSSEKLGMEIDRRKWLDATPADAVPPDPSRFERFRDYMQLDVTLHPDTGAGHERASLRGPERAS